MAVMMVLGFLVLGFLIAVGFGSVLNLLGFAPSTEEILLNELMSICNSKSLIYTQAESEVARKNFCCASSDINQNSIIEDGEF